MADAVDRVDKADTEGLRVHGLHKSYGALKVTDDLSFTLGAGQALGIIGPNGAGKSTLFNLLTGVVRARMRWRKRLGMGDCMGLP